MKDKHSFNRENLIECSNPWTTSPPPTLEVLIADGISCWAASVIAGTLLYSHGYKFQLPLVIMVMMMMLLLMGWLEFHRLWSHCVLHQGAITTFLGCQQSDRCTKLNDIIIKCEIELMLKGILGLDWESGIKGKVF